MGGFSRLVAGLRHRYVVGRAGAGRSGTAPGLWRAGGAPDHGVAQQVERIVGEAGLCSPLYELFDGSRGGFARVDAELTAFIDSTAAIELEPLYTGKALMLLRARVEAGGFAPGTRLIFVHTGGLQGRRGFE